MKRYSSLQRVCDWPRPSSFKRQGSHRLVQSQVTPSPGRRVNHHPLWCVRWAVDSHVREAHWDMLPFHQERSMLSAESPATFLSPEAKCHFAFQRGDAETGLRFRQFRQNFFAQQSGCAAKFAFAGAQTEIGYLVCTGLGQVSCRQASVFWVGNGPTISGAQGSLGLHEPIRSSCWVGQAAHVALFAALIRLCLWHPF